MPLERGKSKAAFSHNVAAEIHAGKPQKQAVAIAYSQKRKAQHMASGGTPSTPNDGTLGGAIGYPKRAGDQEYAEGGEVDEDHESMMNQCADECMKAIEMKDKEGFRDSFHVLVADILNKLSSDMDGE